MDKQYIIQSITDFCSHKNLPFSLELINVFLEALDQFMIHKKVVSLSHADILFVFQKVFPSNPSIDFQEKINAQILPQNGHHAP